MVRIGGIVIAAGGFLLAVVLFFCNIQTTSLIWLLLCAGGAFAIVCSACDADFFFEHHKAHFIVAILGRTGARIGYAIFGSILALFGGVFLLGKAVGGRIEYAPPPAAPASAEAQQYPELARLTFETSNAAQASHVHLSSVKSLAAAEFSVDSVAEAVTIFETKYKAWLAYDAPDEVKDKIASQYKMYENIQKARTELKRITADPEMAEVYRKNKVPF